MGFRTWYFLAFSTNTANLQQVRSHCSRAWYSFMQSWNIPWTTQNSDVHSCVSVSNGKTLDSTASSLAGTLCLDVWRPRYLFKSFPQKILPVEFKSSHIWVVQWNIDMFSPLCKLKSRIKMSYTLQPQFFGTLEASQLLMDLVVGKRVWNWVWMYVEDQVMKTDHQNA